MALDYASIMAAGQQLVPDMRAQLLQDEQLAATRDYRQAQQQGQQVGMQAKQYALSRRQQFDQDAAAAAQSGDPRAIKALMIKYPEFADELKGGWGVLSEEGKTRNITQVGTMYSRALNGDWAGASEILQQRIAADKAAGQDTSEDERLLTALNSGDPQQQKIALSTMGFQLAAVNPDKFGETYGKLNPRESQSAFAKEYDDRVARFGKPAADEWAALEGEKFIPVQPGGSVYRGSDFMGGSTQAAATAPSPTPPPSPAPGPAMSGDQIEAQAKQVVPGVVVTSRKRSPSHNRAVGGQPDSYHLTGQARDFVPPKGMSMDQLHAQLKRSFPGYDVINEGDHVHIEPGPGMGRGGPVRVRTVQEANALPKGTRYITPDGKEFIR